MTLNILLAKAELVAIQTDDNSAWGADSIGVFLSCTAPSKPAQ